MPAYVLMRAFENTPAQYDRAMDVLTLGRVSRLKREIASAVMSGRQRVLDLGCGAGSLAIMMAGRGAAVLGIDMSEPMLEIARRRVEATNLTHKVELRRLSVMEIDALPERSYDFVVCTLLFSELSDDEIEFALRESRRLLAPGGCLLIADETVPPGRLRRSWFAILRFPLQLLTHLVTQVRGLAAVGWPLTILYFTIELPLMLLVFF